MSVKSLLPKWATPERRAMLVELWAIYGNKCLYGHTACMNPEHYTYIQPVGEIASTPYFKLCEDRAGNPILGTGGAWLLLKLYKTQIVTVNQPVKSRLYDYITELVIDGWKADDREARQLEYRLESISLHRLGEPTKPLRGAFSAISKDIWKSSQPLYYIENLGISGLTLKPFAKIRLASSYMRLHVNLGDTLRGVSKNKKRKSIRYGKPLPKSIDETVSMLVRQAVKHYLSI